MYEYYFTIKKTFSYLKIIFTLLKPVPFPFEPTLKNGKNQHRTENKSQAGR
jgi:hypothetical protein